MYIYVYVCAAYIYILFSFAAQTLLGGCNVDCGLRLVERLTARRRLRQAIALRRLGFRGDFVVSPVCLLPSTDKAALRPTTLRGFALRVARPLILRWFNDYVWKERQRSRWWRWR